MLILLTDILVILLSFIGALLIRFKTFVGVSSAQHSTLVFLIITTCVVAYLNSLYERYVYVNRLKIFFKVIKLWFTVLFIYLFIGFITKYYFLMDSRIMIGLYHSFLLILMILFKLFIQPFLLSLYYQSKKKLVRCQFIGPKEYQQQVKEFFEHNPVLGLSLSSADEHNLPDEYFLVTETDDFEILYNEIKKLIKPKKKLHIANRLFNRLNLHWEWGYFNGLPVYTFSKKNNSKFGELLRRLCEFIIAMVLFVIFLPFFLIIALAIKLTSKGAVIYKQKRCGINGQEFLMYKFRSMFDRAQKEQKRELAYKAYLNKEIPEGKVVDENDITLIGSLLRKMSLDELPQLCNVLKGEMGLVGPRPPIAYEVKHYKPWHCDRLLVKPGITGLWQVFGRGMLPSDASFFLDLFYVINRSLRLDFILLIRTIPVVLLGRGAY